MLVEVSGKKVKLPDFFIVGAARSGTTSLYVCLKQHPDVFMPNIKEPGFFVFKDIKYVKYFNKKRELKKYFISSIEEYSKLFEKANDFVIGEASPIYLYKSELAVKNMVDIYKEKSSKIKIIMILRNPIERAWSHYLYLKQKGYEYLDYKNAFDEEVIKKRVIEGFLDYDYITPGFYYRQILDFLQVLNKVNVMIILYDDFKKNPVDICKKIFNFLNVCPYTPSICRINASGYFKNRIAKYIYNNLIITDTNFKRKIKSIIPLKMKSKIREFIEDLIFHKTSMPEDLKLKLIEIYREDISKLQDLINKDLSHWLEL